MPRTFPTHNLPNTQPLRLTMDDKDPATSLIAMMDGTNDTTGGRAQSHGLSTYNSIASLLNQLDRECEAETDLLRAAITQLSLTDEEFRETNSVRGAFIFVLNKSSDKATRLQELRQRSADFKERVVLREADTHEMVIWNEGLGQYYQDRSRHHEVEMRALANWLRAAFGTPGTVEARSSAMMLSACSSIQNALQMIHAALPRENPAGQEDENEDASSTDTGRSLVLSACWTQRWSVIRLGRKAMSFGYSVGDVLAVCKVCYQVAVAIKDGPNELEEARSQLSSLQSALSALHDTNKTGVIRLHEDQKAQLETVLEGCDKTLNDLLELLNGYAAVTTPRKFSRANLKWILKDSSSALVGLQRNIIVHTNSINVLIQSFQSSTIQRMEAKLDQVLNSVQLGAHDPVVLLPPRIPYEGNDFEMSRRLNSLALQSKAFPGEIFFENEKSYGSSSEAYRDTVPKIVATSMVTTSPALSLINPENLTSRGERVFNSWGPRIQYEKQKSGQTLEYREGTVYWRGWYS
ncbi:hypothetical protein FN846DRAFT_920566 [Sphaerosporella brunnea]|uniref:Fungal N-terminal domain-containing protein n=1 Tax=Sphaerosporella brunnea TaxID=1250544 RepID=A0A5J5ERZ9_9PEZI|nr:hypothetical protein FN846DRAFT_920566 [Sphaerosporella brunnea]